MVILTCHSSTHIEALFCIFAFLLLFCADQLIPSHYVLSHQEYTPYECMNTTTRMYIHMEWMGLGSKQA